MAYIWGFVNDYNFVDLDSKGHLFTWSNNRVGDKNVKVRLDKAFATIEWVNRFSKAYVIHDTLIGSNHCPILVYTSHPIKKKVKDFKFKSVWIDSEGCRETTRIAWRRDMRGCSMFNLD